MQKKRLEEEKERLEEEKKSLSDEDKKKRNEEIDSLKKQIEGKDEQLAEREGKRASITTAIRNLRELKDSNGYASELKKSRTHNFWYGVVFYTCVGFSIDHHPKYLFG